MKTGINCDIQCHTTLTTFNKDNIMLSNCSIFNSLYIEYHKWKIT